ncbi:MAG: acyl-ACP desaturase [Melioribacteraceae bacterium]|nr:acyl-ACP desaturase [Melioribacteraceae bacterium]MCF8355250.1 acyl-ACP desaturase [Melioribacteraceae bacterium]MCF8395560.1 acyl-ACP desaturase [Melioribacteraceae bacterium]MCF8420860.1 acyl-ACP desaturase [Melioribacteraceae bacterium]
MTIITSNKNDAHETQSKAEVLAALEDKVKKWMEMHIEKRKLWFSSDFLPAEEKNSEDQENNILKLRQRVKGIKDSARVAIGLNLITEEGLPHFHRLISQHLGDRSFWSKWNNLWTAEEDRHGNVLRDYARDSRLFNFSRLEQMQYVYQEKGFNPDWDKDPYRVFVYTTLQERATQFSHKNTGDYVGSEEPLIKGILTSIAADEAKHYTFYRNVFKSIIEIDPNRALQSAVNILPAIDMPGISMPNFREMADVVRRADIYGPRDYKKIVEEAISFWKIDVLEGLNDIGRKAQDKIMQIPDRLEKVAQYLEKRKEKKSFSFDLIYDRILVME